VDGVGFWFLFGFQLLFRCGMRIFLHVGYVEVCYSYVGEYVALHRVYIKPHMGSFCSASTNYPIKTRSSMKEVVTPLFSSSSNGLGSYVCFDACV
jgi:hypothetical protein